ncbi:MAG: hypothetical protein JOY82_16790 [Streptosporangiaceae bacterium]|nr:hypothetical protein [Streptosporangiaceae bacterium]
MTRTLGTSASRLCLPLASGRPGQRAHLRLTLGSETRRALGLDHIFASPSGVACHGIEPGTLPFGEAPLGFARIHPSRVAT